MTFKSVTSSICPIGSWGFSSLYDFISGWRLSFVGFLFSFFVLFRSCCLSILRMGSLRTFWLLFSILSSLIFKFLLDLVIWISKLIPFNYISSIFSELNKSCLLLFLLNFVHVDLSYFSTNSVFEPVLLFNICLNLLVSFCSVLLSLSIFFCKSEL